MVKKSHTAKIKCKYGIEKFNWKVTSRSCSYVFFKVEKKKLLLFSGGHSDLYPNLPFMPGGINPMPGAAPAPGMLRPRFDPFGPLPDMNQMPGPSRRGRRSGPHPNFPPSFF